MSLANIVPPHDNPWDFIRIDGTPSPGVCTLAGHKRDFGWDIKAGEGQDGATVSAKNDPVGKFSVTFALSNMPFFELVTDLDIWPLFEAKLRESKTNNVAMSIDHPDLVRNGFDAVLLGTIGEMIPDGTGGMSITVGFIEYYPPKDKKTGSGGGATSPSSDTAADSRIQDAQDELDAALADGEDL